MLRAGGLARGRHHEVADLLKREERDAERENDMGPEHATLLEPAQDAVQLRGEKVAVLEPEEQAEVDAQAEVAPRGAR
jgi:hypothetical protein